MDKMYTLLHFTQKAISELCRIILPLGATANISGLPVQPVDILITDSGYPGQDFLLQQLDFQTRIFLLIQISEYECRYIFKSSTDDGQWILTLHFSQCVLLFTLTTCMQPTPLQKHCSDYKCKPERFPNQNLVPCPQILHFHADIC